MNTNQILKSHHQAIIVDGHSDTFSKVMMGYDFFSGKRRPDAKYMHKRGWAGAALHMDYPRIKRSGLDIQFMAIYTPPTYVGADATAYAMKMLFEIKHAIRQGMRCVCGAASRRSGKDAIQLILNRDDIKKLNTGIIGFLISIEGGLPFNGNIALVDTFYQLGMRSMTLTHNPRNELADGIGSRNPFKPSTRKPKGLTPFGRQVIKTANRLGIILDVAHLGSTGFWELARLARGPIISSHTGVRALCDIPRNLDDNQLKEIVRRNGVVGIFYLPEFIVRGKKVISIEDAVNHIQYVSDKFGVDYVGLGSDFDGYAGTCTGLEDVSKLPNITLSLARRGFNKAEITKILGGNFLRVIKQTLK